MRNGRRRVPRMRGDEPHAAAMVGSMVPCQGLPDEVGRVDGATGRVYDELAEVRRIAQTQLLFLPTLTAPSALPR